MITALAIAVAVAGWRLRRLRASRRRSPLRADSNTAPIGGPPSRREHLIALSRAVREALVARFGPAWRSKTTEEIAREAGLEEAFGPEDAARLLLFLHEADRAKFASEGDPASTPSLDFGDDWVEEFVASVAAKSTISGR